ncbi:MAG TPA: hypothetical protein VLN59_13625, partial [Burkholderiales bacterium]|nr:hypothetical protein [Burkholderiales bacterium]
MILLDRNGVDAALTMRRAIDLLENAALHEAAGKTVVSPRLNTNFDTGWMRILFAVDAASGYFATKAYHMIQGVGVRYVISLYGLKDGALLALLDGRTITDRRTGAASGVVARKVSIAEPLRVGVIGSGYQARSQLESLATVYDVAAASVYSPTASHRDAFAREMTAKLKIPVNAVDSPEAAVRDKTVVATASSNLSGKAALCGAWLDGCRLLCAVGSTRREQVEADAQCYERA